MDVRHTITFDADNKAEIVTFHIEAPCLTFQDIERIHTRLHSLYMEQGTPVTYDTTVVIEQARQLAFRALTIAKESRL